MAPVVPEARVVTDGHPQLIALTPRATQRLQTLTRTPRRVVVHRPAPAQPAAVRQRVVAVGYPYAGDSTGASDPWGFTKRQCVSYVAWRVAEAGRRLDNARDGWGSALTWDDTALRLGRRVSAQPVAGAVAQWDAGESGAYWSPGAASADGTFQAGPSGHVAWVTKVYADGSVQVAQYNGTGTRIYSTMRVRAPRYLLL